MFWEYRGQLVDLVACYGLPRGHVHPTHTQGHFHTKVCSFHIFLYLQSQLESNVVLTRLYSTRKEHTKLMSILLVDGFIFFAVVFGAMFTNLLIWAVASVSPSSFEQYPPRVLHFCSNVN